MVQERCACSGGKSVCKLYIGTRLLEPRMRKNEACFTTTASCPQARIGTFIAKSFPMVLFNLGGLALDGCLHSTNTLMLVLEVSFVIGIDFMILTAKHISYTAVMRPRGFLQSKLGSWATDVLIVLRRNCEWSCFCCVHMNRPLQSRLFFWCQ